MQSSCRALVFATLLLVAGGDFNFDLNAEIEKCLAFQSRLFPSSKTKCLDELQQLSVLVFTSEDRKHLSKDRKDRKNTLAIPGMDVDIGNPLSVAVALVFVVSIMAGGILQCWGRSSPKPYLILRIFLGFAFGLVVTVWWMFPSNAAACIFALAFSFLTCGAISVHFLHEDRLNLSQVWIPLTAANSAAAPPAAPAVAAAPPQPVLAAGPAAE
jgi:hypothetical protein